MVTLPPNPTLDRSLLVESRLQLHYAVQLPVAMAQGLLEEADDDSQSNLGFDHTSGCFITRSLVEEGTAAALHVADLKAGIYKKGKFESLVELLGLSPGQALAEYNKRLKEEGVVESDQPFREYADFPEHSLATGGSFSNDLGSGLNYLSALYSAFDVMLSAVSVGDGNRSDIRTWPHHFDLATLVSFPGKSHRAEASVGIGFSPGDNNYSSPYLYVSPWPYPAGELPALPSNGHWHTEGFTAAVLTEEKWSGEVNPTEAAASFLQGAFEAARDSIRVT